MKSYNSSIKIRFFFCPLAGCEGSKIWQLRDLPLCSEEHVRVNPGLATAAYFSQKSRMAKGKIGIAKMKSTCAFQAARRVRLWICLLICLAVFLGGCQAKEPPLSKEAQAFKKEILQEMDKISKRLVEPVSKQNWQAVEPILQTSYQEMEQRGKLVLTGMVVMDRNGITQGSYPPEEERRLDLSSYKKVRQVLDKQKKVTQGVFYEKGEKIYALLSALLQEGKVIGAVGIGFFAKEIEEKWQVSEKEFLSINFNQ
jgi:hypothetical protein